MQAYYSLNALAESFEVDRSTMLRAMRGVPPDLVMRGNRPQWKTATAARALDAHRRKMNGSNGGGGTGSTLAVMYERYDQAEAAMRVLPTLDERRKAARAMLPSIIAMDKATRRIGIANGQDAETVHLRADQMLRLCARGIEAPCAWDHDTVWTMFAETEDA